MLKKQVAFQFVLIFKVKSGMSLQHGLEMLVKHLVLHLFSVFFELSRATLTFNREHGLTSNGINMDQDGYL